LRDEELKSLSGGQGFMWVRECRVRVIYYTSKPHQRIKERQTERWDMMRRDMIWWERNGWGRSFFWDSVLEITHNFLTWWVVSY